mmetsp:Transcript_18971/g.60207  ORF Transcript_18971/g.60207 Transcript_18971/m.60207 type:complete len:443 (-) Transcript_18971:210-1538(-)
MRAATVALALAAVRPTLAARDTSCASVAAKTGPPAAALAEPGCGCAGCGGGGGGAGTRPRALRWAARSVARRSASAARLSASSCARSAEARRVLCSSEACDADPPGGGRLVSCAGPPPSPSVCRSLNRLSCASALEQRSSGGPAQHDCTRARSAAGPAGSSGRSPRSTAASMAAALARSANGWTPDVTHATSTPRLYTSEAGVSARDAAPCAPHCSGAMYSGVPPPREVEPDPWVRSVVCRRARPKSLTLARPPAHTSTLPGLRSPCATPMRCRYASAADTSCTRRSDAGVTPGSAPSSPSAALRRSPLPGWRSCSRDPWSANSSTAHTWPSSSLSMEPMSWITCGWCSWRRSSSSLTMVRAAPASEASTIFTATSTSPNLPRFTTPCAPRPSGLPGMMCTSDTTIAGRFCLRSRVCTCWRRSPQDSRRALRDAFTARPKKG